MKKSVKVFAIIMCVCAVAVTAAFAAGAISEARAKEIALAHASVKQSDVKFIRVKTDIEHGQAVYDVKFYAGGKEYEYDIAVDSGKILKHEAETKRGWDAVSGSSVKASGKMISPAQAKKIALAKVPGATEANIYKFKLDRDDGRKEYEGKILYKNMEYEFEIDARNGKMLKWKVDND